MNKIIIKDVNDNFRYTRPFKEEKCVVYYNGDVIIMQDGTEYKNVFNRFTDIGVYIVTKCSIYLNYWNIKEATLNDANILKMDICQDLGHETVNNNIICKTLLWFTLEGKKRRIKYVYNNSEYPIDYFFIERKIDLTVNEFDFKTLNIRTSRYCGISISYCGGGYGEKYHVSSVNDINVKLFLNEFAPNYYTDEFINYMKYGNSDSEPSWIGILSEGNNWEISEVEYVEYEGYFPKIYTFKKPEKLSELLNEHIKNYKGEILKDWKDIRI